MNIVKREAIFIPIKDISVKEKNRIKEDLTFNFFAKPRICEECEWYAERVNDVCESCANFKGQYQLASQVIVGKNKYLKIPVGSAQPIIDRLGRYADVTYIDKSPKTKIAPIKFTGTFKAGQGEAVAAMLEKKRGVFRAPPRAGKTVMMSALVCQIRRKTLILASQRDWLMGFQETFIGSDTQKPLTNLKKSRIKLCKTLADFQNHDVCLATIQTFYSEGGEKLLAAIRDMFSVILVDEVHTAAADKYSKIMAQLNGEWVIGCSGTPERKDEKEILVENIIGPIIYELKVDQVRPTVKLTRTGYSKTIKGQVPWARLVSGMENDKKRIDVIAKQALRDVKDGHMILLPVAQVKPIKKIVDRINELAGKTLAYSFTGSLPKAKRDLYIQKAREYKIKILVGTQKILSVGINIPRASMLYECVLSSNLPNARQRMARVCTPYDGKPAPGIRFFLDDFSVRRNCMRNEYYRVLIPTLKPIISQKDKELIELYFKSKDFNAGGKKFDL
jgi:superfamily II DNA or RNA helicase